MSATTYSFLPWVRQGTVSAVPTEDNPVLDPLGNRLSAHATFPARVQLADVSETVDVNLRLHGPADVLGIDPRQVAGTTPAPGTRDFPPSCFPAIEFDRADFPWLFTPARAERQQGRLRPWLVLVVVRKQQGVTLGPRGGPLPVLDIRFPALASTELPDLSESWAWAHAQVLHDGDPGALDAVLSGEPSRTVSRLLAPRRLEPHANYYACVVPAFDVARKAGLGLPVDAEDETRLRPAWGSGADAPSQLQLPVYHHWSFSTGAAADFEAAVRLLRPLDQLPGTVGGTRMHIGNGGVPSLPDLKTVDIAGVFRPTHFTPPLLPLPDNMSAEQKEWVRQLTLWLNHADDAARGDTDQAIVTIPLYGRYQQALLRLPAVDGWMRDLNLDPRNRAAAGLGVLFVQWHQEALMASAWEQLGELQQAQQLVRSFQLAREVGNAIFAKRLASMAGKGELLFQATSPVHASVQAAGAATTIAAWAAEQCRPIAATLATFRRVARPGGAVVRRFRGTATTLAAPLTVQQFAAGPADPGAIKTFVTSVPVRVTEIKNRRTLWSVPTNDAQAVARAAAAIDALVPQLERLGAIPVVPPPPPMQPVDGAQAVLLEQLRPELTLTSRMRARLSAAGTRLLAANVAADAPGAEPVAYPEFPQPMYEAVRELMPELLLTGAEDLPENTVTLLETNPQFIEAFMVGLNHEMARELLWRGFPTDLRGSYFRCFWGATAEGNQSRAADVPELHRWDAKKRLGGNLTDGHVEGQLVLVFKGDLLRRFPNTVIYAVQATAAGGLSTIERHPLHRGVAGDGAVFLLFDLTEKQARGGAAPGGDGGPGWFFVLQEQPTEPRFGLDTTAAASGTPTRWADLAWEHVTTSAGGYLQVAASAPGLSSVTQPPGLTWGFNGAHMADIALQRAFRVAIHARRLL